MSVHWDVSFPQLPRTMSCMPLPRQMQGALIAELTVCPAAVAQAMHWYPCICSRASCDDACTAAILEMF